MKATIIFLALVLAGCGVDGAPEPKNNGINISGEVKVGVVGEL